MTALLAIDGLRAWYGDVEALHGIDLSVGEGAAVALLGANGAGKTTTLRAISGLVRRTGAIRFRGRDISRLEPEETARLGIGHVPEGRGTFAALTVEENLRLGALTRRDRGGVRQDLEQVLGWFPRLADRLRQQAGTLSGGEQQMLAISRALLMRPELLLLDEPSFGLAPLVVREIFAILARINRERGVGILLVEQNARLALALAGEALLLETGRIVLAGPADAIAADADVRRAYLGEA